VAKKATITQEIEARDDHSRLIRIKCDQSLDATALARFPKHPTQTVLVYGEDSAVEARLHGHWVVPPMHEGAETPEAAIAAVESKARQLSEQPPRIVVLEGAGVTPHWAVLGYTAFPETEWYEEGWLSAIGVRFIGG